MINNNMKMVKELKNIPDYDEYVALCKKNNTPSNDLNKYCLGVGMLSVARFRYPELEWQEAYTNTIRDMDAPKEVQKKEENGCCLGDKKDAKPLGLIDTAKNLVKSTKEHISKGMSHVSPEEYVRRLSICKDCQWIEEGFQCGQCHCFMGVKAGWDIKNGCKLNKW